MKSHSKKQGIGSFPGIFWLVIFFEFIERGSYYGVMSYISIYFVDQCNFAKESVGMIKGVIQPLLYFLPIISGALADRFGYRKLLMWAFSIMGLGYFLTSQTQSFGPVFVSLVVLGTGAGLFKPLISGSIAKMTHKDNSTLGFGIYYWSINIGAFLFPTILVYILKKISPVYPILAAAVFTASMLLPTFFFFREPGLKEKNQQKNRTGLIQTVANAFEIIYSPILLLGLKMIRSKKIRIVSACLLLVLLAGFLYQYLNSRSTATGYFSKVEYRNGEKTLVFSVERDMLEQEPYLIQSDSSDSRRVFVTLFKPDKLQEFIEDLKEQINQTPGFEMTTSGQIEEWIQASDKKIQVDLIRKKDTISEAVISEVDPFHYILIYPDKCQDKLNAAETDLQFREYPRLSGITELDLAKLLTMTRTRPFFPLFAVLLITAALTVVSIRMKSVRLRGSSLKFPFLVILTLGFGLWFIPGLSMLARCISFIVYLSVTSLFQIDLTSPDRFKDHSKFLLMIFIYSGFWILYFQMFDSVLWYVQAYVDAGPLNRAVNDFLGLFGLHIHWIFDVEHVTTINAATIILLQLLISVLVKNRKALPTMIFGIFLGTCGMAVLAVGFNIWIFMTGIMIFSIGEMTAHPKFYSYIGLIAPKGRKAMYMGYSFLYGVIGSSIGSITGAKLYVHFVDNLNQPRILWLLFSGIGVITCIGLALFNRTLAPRGQLDE
jgi:dipeptide/tripeptide permease